MTARVYTLQIQRAATAINAAGSPASTWADLVTLRAEIVDAVAEEFQRTPGASDEIATTFQTRFVDGITPADRLHFAGRFYDIRSLKMLGRRRGLEIVAIAKGTP